ncbi:MAG: hypothetical protein IJZ57_02240 [Clostridia bacterium]|nr:hypothetical protein [Clostridia bacterium]
MNFSFKSFVDGSFDYDFETETHTCLWLRNEKMDISGGTITIEDIDKLKDYPDTDVVTVSGLHQDTFEYFIKTYGGQLKAIRFFKNKFVEDWSLLGTLEQLEYVYFFFNQRITSLWDMSKNTSLTGLCIEDFTRLSSISGIDTAPALKEFRIGNAIWDKMVIDSLMPLAHTNIENFMFCGKSIIENDFSFLGGMPNIKQFDFPANMLTTEQVAWIVSNFPHLQGFALKPIIDSELYNSSMELVPAAGVVGKRKPTLIVEGNEKRIEKYVRNFEELKKKYVGVPYKTAFPE